MANKTTHKTPAKTQKPTGKKGGVGVLTPETIGAMAGAAIGGVAGMMIGNHHRSKGKVAIVKAGAVTAAKSAVNVLEAQTQNLKSESKTLATKPSRKQNTHKK